MKNNFLKKVILVFALLAYVGIVPLQAAQPRHAHAPAPQHGNFRAPAHRPAPPPKPAPRHGNGGFRPAPPPKPAPRHGGHRPPEPHHVNHNHHGISKGRMNTILAIQTVLGIAALIAH